MADIFEAIKAVLTWLGMIFEGVLGWFGVPVSVGAIITVAFFLFKTYKN